uniref:GNAT family N-acetyltransferase n=1 Tax=Herbidospora sakaeratensis TaxID=564415 RepID=UPI00078082F8|nr:GNAT family protein [Herbidospora sakaeratensis]
MTDTPAPAAKPRVTRFALSPAPATPKTTIFPHTVSRRLALHPAGGSDQRDFAQLFVRTGVETVRPAVRPGQGGAMRAYAAFRVTRLGTGEQVGFGGLHNLDPAGHVRCAVYMNPDTARLGVGSEAILLVVNYAFATLDVERVIGQTTQASFSSFGISDRDERTGALPQHLYFRGRYWDLHNFQVERSDWEAYIDRRTDWEEFMGKSSNGVLPPSLDWRTAPDRPFDVS